MSGFDSLQVRAFWGAITTLLLLFAFQAALVHMARKNSPKRAVSFWDLIVTTEDEKYSLSRFQYYLWFVVILISYGAVCFAKGMLANIPEGLYLLMGVNTASAVASSAITFAKGTFSSGRSPNFFTDLFLDTKNSLDLPRTQMFAWTIALVVGYVLWVFRLIYAAHDPNGLTLPQIDNGLIVLMGISHSAYLGAKAVETSTDIHSAPLGQPVKPSAPEPQEEWRQAQQRFQRLLTQKHIEKDAAHKPSS